MILPVVLSFVCLSLAGLARAGTVTYNNKIVTYNWNVTWVWASPDGKFGRPVIGINGKWPCPTMEATVGDTVIVNINNQLGNQTTGLHFHGINQVWTPDMDGSTGSTQCPVPPNSSLQYKFTVDGPGTFWCKWQWRPWYSQNLKTPARLTHDCQTTLMIWASTLMACVVHLLSTTRKTRSRRTTMRSTS
jgi:iron transport multicopper oxidase